MEPKSCMMLKVLINCYNPKAGNALTKFLPKEEAEQVTNWKIDSSDIKPILFHPQNLVKRLHYSWIVPIVKRFPEPLWSHIIAALPQEQATSMQKALELEKSPSSASPPIKSFIINQIYSSLDASQRLPLEYLNESPLLPLADWNKKRLVMLIDFLGLHDLASEMRHIVNKQHLENFTSCLTQKQNYYLKVCLHQKEKLVPPKLGINPAEKNPERLKAILHQRGITRLSNALAGQQHDLIWYLAHILDTGRGKILLDNYKQDPIPNKTQVFITQVTNLMNFLTKE